MAVWSCLFLPHGFNATDEGYLTALGQRVVNGENPHVDFYFLRTPLSIYIQAGLILLFGENYTLLMSRIVWTFQQVLLVLLLAIAFRRYFRGWSLLVVMSAAWAAATLIMAFGWYNYDAAFFAIVSALLFLNRRYLSAGLAAFLAGMAKQNFLLLLPLILVGGLALRQLLRDDECLSRRAVRLSLVGFALPAAAYAIWLGVTGALGSFVENVFLYPPKAAMVPLWFSFFQNHHEAFVRAIPMVVLLVAAFFANPKKLPSLLMLGLAAVATGVVIFRVHHNFVYSLLFLNYATLGCGVLQVARGKLGGDPARRRFVLAALLFGVIIQYLAGFNYVGLVLASVGSGLALFGSLALLREWGPRRLAPALGLVLCVGLLAGGIYHKYTYVYRDAPRAELTVPFDDPLLRGIKSTERNVRQIEDMITVAKRSTLPGDPVFVFPDFPVLYYLTGRKNPTPIGWFVQMEYGGPMTTRAIEALIKDPPELIFVQKYYEVDFLRSGGLTIDYAHIPRYAPFVDWIWSHYDMAAQVGDVYVFTPKPVGEI